MLETSQEYKDAIASHEAQHIFGAINTKSGSKIYLSHEVLIGNPSYTRQCTSTEDEFGIGQMYVGTANITVDLPGTRREDLRGGTLYLEFKAGQSEFLMLGTWTITDPCRDASGNISITASDCISKLDVPINENYVGAITLESRMEKVTELTGVTFAQTPQELYQMIGLPFLFGTHYCNSCRAEVAAIAQLIGGFACDDRYGRIIFKKFGKEPVMSISADERHSIFLAEYTFGLRGAAYDNGYGHTTILPFGTDKPEPNTAAVITVSDNPYMDIAPSQSVSDIDRGAKMYLRHIAENLNIPDWTPGQIEYYGDPALELGDMITVIGGINGENAANFLITAESWQFRGPHTLISAGAAEGGGGTSAAGTQKTQTQQIITNINVTKSITAVELKSYEGVLTDVLRTVAEGGFSCREETVAFVYVTANTVGLGAAEVRINVLYDGVKQTVHAVEKIVENGVMTIHFSLNITAAAGAHTVSVEAVGDAEIQRITACVWGQGIVGEQAVPTNAADYKYAVSGSSATITEYIGSSRKPSVPAVLGGAAVKVIGDTAFIDSDVEFVYIPEGVEKIL